MNLFKCKLGCLHEVSRHSESILSDSFIVLSEKIARTLYVVTEFLDLNLHLLGSVVFVGHALIFTC